MGGPNSFTRTPITCNYKIIVASTLCNFSDCRSRSTRSFAEELSVIAGPHFKLCKSGKNGKAGYGAKLSQLVNVKARNIDRSVNSVKL